MYKSHFVNELKLWNPSTGDLISNLKNHSANLTSIVLDSNGECIEMIGTGKPIELHDIGHETRTFKGYSSVIQTQAYSSDGNFIAIIGAVGFLEMQVHFRRLVPIKTGTRQHKKEVQIGFYVP